MAQQRITISTAVRKALDDGRFVEAIKVLRQEAGLDLRQSKAIVDGLRWQGPSGDMATASGTAATDALPQDVVDAFLRDGLIAGIKRLREARPGLQLADATKLVKQLDSIPHQPLPPSPASRRSPIKSVSAARPTIEHGDSGRNGWLVWLLLVVAAALAWAWFAAA